MTKRLFFEAMTKFLSGVILCGGLLFISAGTFDFFGGRLLMLILFVPMFVAGIFLMIKNPELLKKRLYMKEKQKEQKLVVGLSGIMFVCGFVIAGLGVRFNWFTIPVWGQIVSALIFIAGYIMYAEVIRENKYLSRTIEVQENQKVIDKGLYGVVRHPMYLAATVLFLNFPLVLGSWFSFAIFCFFPFVLVKRIKNEEDVLEKGLNGYKEYKQKVKYKMIPFIW